MTDSPKAPRDAHTAEELRTLCYQVAADMHLAKLAIETLDGYQSDETLVALSFQLERLENTLSGVAGGETFDRLAGMERRKVVRL